MAACALVVDGLHRRRRTLLAFVAAGLAACAADAQATGVASADFLPALLADAKQRALGPQAPQSLCSLELGRPNFFLVWPYQPEEFGQQAYATLETVLFHHPAANVIIVSAGPAPKHLDPYLAEGYCVAHAYVGLEVAERLFAAATSPEAAAVLVRRVASAVFSDDGAYLSLLNGVALALQVLYGGVSSFLDGLLLNPFDFMLPRQLTLQKTALLLELLLPPDGPEHPQALQAEDFEKSWLPRSHADRADGRTMVCVDLVCPRALPARGALSQALLESWLNIAMGSGPDMNQVATALYRSYVRKRPAALPVQSELLTFDHEIVLLPYWVVVEPHFPDGWKAYGGKDGPMTEHSQIFSPRPRREPTDWSLVSSSKLWMPLTYGPPSARNILARSVVDLAMRRFTLGIMPVAYRQKSFGGPRKAPSRRLTSAKDTIVDFDLGSTKAAQNEAALPGAIGGFRTFRQVRLVGREPSGASGGPTLPWRVRISTPRPGLNLFCRREARPIRTTGEASSTPQTAAFRACSASLRSSATSPAGAGADGRIVLFEACGSAGELNAALSLLAYEPLPGLARAPPLDSAPATGSLDWRLGAEELAEHFAELRVEASPTCAGGPEVVGQTLTVDLAALLDDPEEHVTVVAHCAERCHLLDRLATSFREPYPKITIIATCECSEEEYCPEPVARPHPSIPHMTVVSVPYDYGLSRGKSLLSKMAQTEFLLVLDDDFVHSFHSCLECMLWRMRSRYHSLWRPFDILGFPVLEDERNFGAFRGKIRIASHQLFLEPMAEQITPDGCMRVDICPMVFLARTARFRAFRFSEDLRVGEHEKFFYSNTYFGMQVAVCFDSSFPHFRVNTMSAGYVKRRARMPELMLSAFKNLGFERAMFLFRKYAHGDAADHEELLEKAVPPWYISDDTCGQRPSPPVPFAQIFVVILSTADAAGERYRRVLRGSTDAAAVWLQRFTELGHGIVRWIFAVATREEPSPPESVVRERDEHRDIIFLSHGSRPNIGLAETSAEQLLHLAALMRDFQFRWLVVARQDVFVHFERLLATLQAQEPPQRKVLGSWRAVGAAAAAGAAVVGAATAAAASAVREAAVARSAAWRIDPHFFALSRDVFALLALPELNSRLTSVGRDLAFGDVGALSGGLSTWLHGLAVDRVALPGMHLERYGAESAGVDASCPSGTLALHPVSPERLYALSRSPSAALC